MVASVRWADRALLWCEAESCCFVSADDWREKEERTATTFGSGHWEKESCGSRFNSAKSGGGAWPCARHNHALVAVSETMLLLHGGATHGEKKGKHFEQVYLGDIWTFDIAAGTWTKHEESPSWPHRHYHALHKENDGRLVLIWRH